MCINELRTSHLSVNYTLYIFILFTVCFLLSEHQFYEDVCLLTTITNLPRKMLRKKEVANIYLIGVTK